MWNTARVQLLWKAKCYRYHRITWEPAHGLLVSSTWYDSTTGDKWRHWLSVIQAKKSINNLSRDDTARVGAAKYLTPLTLGKLPSNWPLNVSYQRRSNSGLRSTPFHKTYSFNKRCVRRVLSRCWGTFGCFRGVFSNLDPKIMRELRDCWENRGENHVWTLGAAGWIRIRSLFPKPCRRTWCISDDSLMSE